MKLNLLQYSNEMKVFPEFQERPQIESKLEEFFKLESDYNSDMDSSFEVLP